MNKKRMMFVRMVTASLLRRRSRTIVALLAIIVGATILSGLGMIYFDVPRQMSAQFRSYGANIIFTPSDDGYIDKDSLEKGISCFSKEQLEGYTPYRYENTSIHNIPVTLAGTDFSGVLKTSPYWHINGSMPSSDGEALIGAKAAEKLGISVGDSISAQNSFEVTDETDLTGIPDYEIYTDPETGEKYCDHMLELKAAGILETGGSEEEYIYVTLADIQSLTLSDRGYDIVEVSVAAMQDELKDYLKQVGEKTPDISARLVKRVTASESTVLTKLEALVLIVTIVVLALTMICVATTMTAVIAERRKEIGLRKALGAQNSSIMAEFLSEVLVLGGVGGIAGSLLGFVFADIVSMNVFSSPITFRPLLLPITIAASVIVTGLACMIPIKSAVEVDPALVLKGE